MQSLLDEEKKISFVITQMLTTNITVTKDLKSGFYFNILGVEDFRTGPRWCVGGLSVSV